MINIDRSHEVRIKRANTDWWIHEQSMVGANGMTYIAYYTDMGEIHIKEIDAKCSRTLSRDYCLCRLNCNYADEHNAPSLCVLENGKIIVAYTGHAQNNTLKYRITERPYDISSFGPEHTLKYKNSVTYVQLSENTTKNELWLFCRVNSVTWEFRYSQDEGETFSNPVTFLISEAKGLFYFDIHKQLNVGRKKDVSEQWMFALYGHPLTSKDHTIRSGIFNNDGYLMTMDGEVTDVNLYNGDKIDLSKLDVVYVPTDGTTCRLLSVAPTLPYRVGFATFEINKPETITYFSASWRDGKWNLSSPIAKGGEFLSPSHMVDGSQTYVGGMAYYYGVGEAGLYYPRDFAYSETNRIFIARRDGKDRVLESYISADFGQNYILEQTIRKIPTETNIKIWRPTVPIHAQDNLPLYWHEGIYGAHTGGWHCDEVMYIEYDD